MTVKNIHEGDTTMHGCIRLHNAQTKGACVHYTTVKIII